MNQTEIVTEIDALKKSLEALKRNATFSKKVNAKLYLLEEKMIKKEIEKLEMKLLSFGVFENLSNE